MQHGVVDIADSSDAILTRFSPIHAVFVWKRAAVATNMQITFIGVPFLGAYWAVRELAGVGIAAVARRSTRSCTARWAMAGTGYSTTSMQELRSEVYRAIDTAPQMRRVIQADKDLERFMNYDVFKHYLGKRFSLQELQRRGEDSFIRRVMHLYLVDKQDPEYVDLLKTWEQLREEKELGGGRTQQGGTLDKLWSSSKDGSEKASVAKALYSARKSVEQLSANVEKLKADAAESGDEGEGVGSVLEERMQRLELLQAREAVTARLVEVVGRLDEKLEELRGKVLPLAVASNAAYLEECRQGGPATEQEVQALMKQCLQSPGLGALKYLTGVDIKSLNGQELREQLRVAAQKPQYSSTEFPKAELDGLIVIPRHGPGGKEVWQVLLAVEVKRSIDDLPNDCGKYHLLLDILRETCRQSLHHCIKYRYTGQESSGPSEQVLDFSDVQGIYVVKVGSQLRVAEPLLHAVVQMVSQADQAGTERRLLDYFSIDFARALGLCEAEAQEKRDSVTRALYEQFMHVGLDISRRRLEYLTNQLLVEGLLNGRNPSEHAMRVYTLTPRLT